MPSWFSGKRLILIAAIAGLLNILPLLLVTPAGDLLNSYALIQCYGEQLWQGHFYPRWCMNANAGYGSPIPIFYFPLPYMLAAIFYPLHWFGMEIPGIYLVMLWLAATVTFLTTSHWLRSITTPAKAAFCAFIFLWCSYRMEVAAFRSSYAELWCIALLPLIFAQLKNICWPRLAFVIALCLLCHAPLTMIGLMGAGIYLLWASNKRIRDIFLLALSTALAFAATWFHWQAAREFAPALSATIGGVASWKNIWVNRFVNQAYEPELRTSLALLAMDALVIVILLFLLIKNKLLTRNVTAWCWISFFGIAMMFSYSQPLWDIIEHISQVKTPWRMAILPSFGMVYFIAIYAEHKKPRCFLAIITALFFIVTGAQLVQNVPTPNIDARNLLIATQPVFRYFNTRWTAEKYADYTRPDFFNDFVFNRPKERATLQGGSAEVTQWNNDAIIIKTHTAHATKLRIEQLYFPLWHAEINGAPVEITPEPYSLGRMQVGVPAGDSNVRITFVTPGNYRWSYLAALASLCIMSAGFFMRKRGKPCE